MNYTLVAIGKDVASFPYLFKLSTILKDLGELDYIHWDRSSENDTPEILDSINYKSIFNFYPKSKSTLLLGYIGWFFSLLFYFMFKANTNRLYFVSRLDAAGAIYIASIFRKSFKYVYLDRDAYHMTYSLGVFKSVVKKIEGLVGTKAAMHFIPGRSRDFTGHGNVRVIENTPNMSFFQQADERGKLLKKDKKLTIYVNGWLVKSRGADFILKAAKALNPTKFRIIVAGPLQCDAIKSLIMLDIVDYLGQLNNIDSLSYYFISDVVLTFYDPTIEINVKAEPNKWFDCLFTETHFITNYGIKTAEPFIKAGLGYEVNYDDHQSLIGFLERIENKRDSLSNPNIQELKSSLGLDFWDVKVRNYIVDYVRDLNK